MKDLVSAASSQDFVAISRVLRQNERFVSTFESVHSALLADLDHRIDQAQSTIGEFAAYCAGADVILVSLRQRASTAVTKRDSSVRKIAGQLLREVEASVAAHLSHKRDLDGAQRQLRKRICQLTLRRQPIDEMKQPLFHGDSVTVQLLQDRLPDIRL